jgi:rod shape-determining protein MreD
VTQLFWARVRIAVLLFVAILIQTTLGSDLRLFQVAPDLMLLIVVCAGMTGGTESGAWVGFWAGLISDMFLTATPVGLSALAYCLVGAAVGALRSNYLQDRRLLLPAAALVGTAAGVVLFVTVGEVLGQTQLLASGRSWLIRVAVLESLWGAVLSVPVGMLYARLARGTQGAVRLGTGPSGGSEGIRGRRRTAGVPA